MTNVVLNRIVLAALIAARAPVTDCALAFDLQNRTAHLRELCSEVPLTFLLLEEAEASLDRRSEYYLPILKLAEMILLGLGGVIDRSERSARLSSFLLDMNLLFERFVSRLLTDFCPPGLRVETQVSQGAAYRWRGNPHGWQRPRLRPDIVLYDSATNRPCLILDAKYKPLGTSQHPAPEDLYQLTLYSMSFGDGSYVPARIIYPCADDYADPPPTIDFRGAFRNRTMATIGFFPLPIVSITSALQRKDDTALRQIVRALIQ